MKFINDWSSNAKQTDKIALEVRIGSLTIFEFSVDVSINYFRLTVLNFSIVTE
jgi:hypothetical protein